MRRCEQCLENVWDYEYLEGIIRATCRLCDYEVEWESKKLRRKRLKQEKILYYEKFRH